MLFNGGTIGIEPGFLRRNSRFIWKFPKNKKYFAKPIAIYSILWYYVLTNNLLGGYTRWISASNY